MSGKHERLAQRLAVILQRLNNGERIHIDALAEEFGVSRRIIQKDLNQRLSLLEDKYAESRNGYYRLDKNKLGHLTEEDVKRFAAFAGIQNLFPETDRRFFSDMLIRSIAVKGFQYEDIKNRRHEFDQIQTALDNNRPIRFHYTKA